MNTFLTVEQLAERLHRSPRTIQRWCNERRIPHMKIGRTIRFLPHQVTELLDAYSRDVIEKRPEADVPNDRYQPYAKIVPMIRDAAR